MRFNLDLFDYYLIVKQYSMNTENREIMPGETMFDYLKRKKKFILEKTLNRGKGNREPLH